MAKNLPTRKYPVVFTAAVGSPFTLTSTWAKVATTTAATNGLRLAPTGAAIDAGTLDIEWTAVAAGAPAPTETIAERILAGEDFTSGLPIGDVYARSVTGQQLIVKVGA